MQIFGLLELIEDELSFLIIYMLMLFSGICEIYNVLFEI